MPDYVLSVRVRNNKVERVTVYDQYPGWSDFLLQLKLRGKKCKKVSKLVVKKSLRKAVVSK